MKKYVFHNFDRRIGTHFIARSRRTNIFVGTMRFCTIQRIFFSLAIRIRERLHRMKFNQTYIIMYGVTSKLLESGYISFFSLK
jgi:hypothetical protein